MLVSKSMVGGVLVSQSMVGRPLTKGFSNIPCPPFVVKKAPALFYWGGVRTFLIGLFLNRGTYWRTYLCLEWAQRVKRMVVVAC